MAKVKEITVFYEETGSSSFQSAKIGMSTTLVLEDGENAGAVFLQYLKAQQERVAPQVEERVEFLLTRKKANGWA